MGDDGIYVERFMYDEIRVVRPSMMDVRHISKCWKSGDLSRYFVTLRDLMLAGFCLLFACTSARGEDIFKPTGRYAQRETITVTTGDSEPVNLERTNNPGRFKFSAKVADPAKRREWYLVSEPWCSACPAAKQRFLALGWPPENILTLAECERRFGFRPDHVPFEFGEPVAPVKESLTTPAMSHAEMVATHNRLHGGGSWTWPGDLAEHLRTTHKVDTGTPVKSQPLRIQQSGSSCPTGNCPTNRTQRRGGFLRGLFR